MSRVAMEETSCDEGRSSLLLSLFVVFGCGHVIIWFVQWIFSFPCCCCLLLKVYRPCVYIAKNHIAYIGLVSTVESSLTNIKV